MLETASMPFGVMKVEVGKSLFCKVRKAVCWELHTMDLGDFNLWQSPKPGRWLQNFLSIYYSLLFLIAPESKGMYIRVNTPGLTFSRIAM